MVGDTFYVVYQNRAFRDWRILEATQVESGNTPTYSFAGNLIIKLDDGNHYELIQAESGNITALLYDPANENVQLCRYGFTDLSSALLEKSSQSVNQFKQILKSNILNTVSEDCFFDIFTYLKNFPDVHPSVEATQDELPFN